MEYVDVARAQSERGEIVLRERRDPHDEHGQQVLELRVNGVFVMDTLQTDTERQLATAALAQVSEPRAVAVGGLGLGYTVHEVLGDHRVERAVVVEIEDTLVCWMRDGTIPHGPALLADERLHMVVADIRMAVNEATPSTYDLMLLDVDNGPDYLVHDGNAAVYQKDFLVQTFTVLRPGGALVIWSASEAPALAERMASVFGNVEPLPHDVRLPSGDGTVRPETYWLYLSRR